MQVANNKNQAQAAGSERPELDRRYGKIGISAVAAAVRYQSAAKNPAYAPAASRLHQEPDEAAA